MNEMVENQAPAPEAYSRFERNGTLFLLLAFGVVYLSVVISAAILIFDLGPRLFALSGTVTIGGLGSGFRLLTVWLEIAFAIFVIYCSVKAWKSYNQLEWLQACIWIGLPQAIISAFVGLTTLLVLILRLP